MESTSSDVPKMPMEGEEFKPPLPPTAPLKSALEAEAPASASTPEGQLPYAPPSWSCKPLESECRLEVIKNGVEVERVPLTSVDGEGSFVAIGRFKPCHILLEHPSVSRYHCILQYGQFMSQEPRWFLYDLGSTHGTKLNKRLLKKHSYTELRPGYVFQLADSSRIFSFCGPVNEAVLEEEEKAMREAHRPVRGPQLNPHGDDLEDGEDEDPSTSDGGAADDRRAAYYEKDPVGWLQKYFEREGMQLRFQYTRADTVSEGLESMKPKRRKGGGDGADWVCSIDLPDDSSANSPVTLIKASAFTRKLAQFHCALIACERLEAGGLLRSYSMWNKRVTYAENDYYDSDEDVYLDRTGQIEEQREKRMRREEALSSTGVRAQNYAELSAKLADSENKLNIVRSELARLMGKNVYTDSEGNVSASTNLSTRMALSQMRSKEKKLVVEVNELQKLVELSRPPDMEKMFPTKKPVAQPADKGGALAGTQGKGERLDAGKDETKMVEDVQLVEDTKPSGSSEGAKHEEEGEGPSENGPEPGHVAGGRADGGVQAKKRSQQPTADFLMPKYGIITKEEARIKRPMRVKKRTAQETEELNDDYAGIPLESQEDYATWLPPKEQTGDGRTKLNEKFKGRY